MVNYNPLQNLPSSDELPDSDDTPVDHELQILIPTLLRIILNGLWASRNDWFFGVNMGIYHTTGRNPRIAIVPDSFLSLGVPRLKDGKLRPSYIVWEENNIVPIWVLEVVSKTYGEEYGEKMTDYARLGVLYYCVYNPDYWRRHKHDPLEVYRLVDGKYVRQPGEPVWMPEIGLGIGSEIGTHDRCQREWLYWYDEKGNRFPTPDEREQKERQRADRLLELLRERGIDPETLS
jgi:Uma2 family endonuclease